MSFQQGVCFDFQRGICRRKNCKFRHTGRGGRGGVAGGGGRGSGSTNGQQRRGVCHEFVRNGTCRFGNKCKFDHPGNLQQQAQQQSVSKQSNNDIKKFIKHLSQVQPNKLGGELEQSFCLWQRCWHEHKTLDAIARRIMIETLAKIPGSSSVHPPAIDVIKKAFEEFLGSKAGVGDDIILSQGKTVLAAVKRLLQFEWDPPRQAVEDGLTHVVILAEGKLKKQVKDHRVLSSELMQVVEDLETPWRIKMKEDVLLSEEVEDLSQAAASYKDWKSANVAWLCNPEYFAPSTCPKMKVGSLGVYDSSEHYIDTVYRLWIAMTFSDGHAAFAPHCRARNQSGNGCNSSLWPVSETANVANLRCRTKDCRAPVEFTCRIKNHDSLCKSCALLSISRHKKGPDAKAHASTHIYDCKVSRLGEDGVLYLSEFQSRNPPPTSIHWRTTKRLSPPNLLGVVKVRAKGSELQDADLIKWGECAYHGQSYDEERRRNRGELAINMSSIVDLDPDYFEVNTYVAVIDCMTFVPEWIPVLKALESQKEVRLPFDNGKHLNLIKEDPVPKSFFWSNLPSDAISVSNSSELIDRMVDESSLEPIREIRRSANLRDELSMRLRSLVTEATLDKGQLMSFIDSLQHPVHLTQGPPGTGKSYLGVVLVRALIIIRELWLKKTNGMSSPPILVLSYKNHAIDEFLVDLVKAEPAKLSRNKLIRIGGQCKDQRLAMYSERNTFQSDPSVQQKRSCLQALNNLRTSIQVTVNSHITSFLSHRQSYRAELDPKNKRKIVEYAVQTLMEMIARRFLLQNVLSALKDAGDTTTPTNVTTNLDFLQIQAVGNDHMASGTIRRFWQKDRRTDMIPHLSKEVEHYETLDHWGDILVMWLSGKKPLLPCAFKSDQDGLICGKRSYDPTVDLCDDHRCRHISTGTNFTRCPSICSTENDTLCQKHVCGVDHCRFAKMNDQNFCEGHCCRRCLELSQTSKMVNDLPPRNFCEDHPACLHPSCFNQSKSGGIFCEEHDVTKCLALNKKKKPCKGKPMSRMMPYCWDHKHLAPMIDFGSESEDDASVSLPVESSAERAICAATTKKGKPCKGPALPGKRFCYDHDIEDEKASSSNDQTRVSGDPGQMVAVCPEESAGPGGSEAAGEQGDVASVVSRNSSDSFATAASNIIQGSTVPLDFDEAELEGEEEGENLQHLREVFEIEENDSDDFFLDGEIEEHQRDTGNTIENSIFAESFAEASEWNWNMSEDERWAACQNLLADLRRSMNTADGLVRRCIVTARKEYQQAIMLAKSKVYENKSVIGGTMVGCISRLDSIRVTRPFAVVVEEASEVLEPLLFSCLTESTIKLEMIGDHRQLQPSVMSRYEFEIHSKINISMFQRLIEAPDGHEIPSTVLSIQRRMRPNLCDLTRTYYADVVEIEDEERCLKQLIGSRISPTVKLNSSTFGREVPGIGPHVFLWTHNGAQKRSNVGISRINPVEATMACSLASYLVTCGVPTKSIAILTPYKGQLMEIRKMLIKGPDSLLSRNPQDSNVCRVSTVDRFQGDEEDIIICSLVVDENSKTNFVKLVNRMIVLLSRARCGMYILGNAAYFRNQSNVPQHWRNTLQLLETSGRNDSTIADLDSTDLYAGPRVGEKLPLCCPVHRYQTKDVLLASELKLGFCTEICQEALFCGHECRLPCHWPSKSHNQKCQVEMDCPCTRHPRKVACHELYKNAPGASKDLPISDVLPLFRCSLKVDLTLPCKHVIKKPCWEEERIESKELAMPICNQKSPVSYDFPNCEHSLDDVTCSELERFNDCPSAVKCEKIEDYHPPCGHIVQMKCWMATEYRSDLKVFNCQKPLTTVLPRCGHRHTVPCSKSRSLESWTGNCCQEIGKVLEGTVYGSEDYKCKEEVSLVRQCGHNLTGLKCSDAMSKSCSWPPCKRKVQARRPDCGHACKIHCYNQKILNGVDPPENPIDEVQEGNVPPPCPQASLFPRCTEKIKFIRRCGHVETVECSESRKPRSGCKILLPSKSPMCGHDIQVPCCRKSSFDMAALWDAAAVNSIDTMQSIPADAALLRNSDSLDPDEITALQSCKGDLSMALPCGHFHRVPCNELLIQIEKRNEIRRGCQEETFVELDCGHVVVATCMEAYRFKSREKHSLVCNQTKLHKCWNFAHCRKKIRVMCGFEGSIACTEDSEWTCLGGKHTFRMKVCSTGVPDTCPGCCLDYIKAESLMPLDNATQMNTKLQRVLSSLTTQVTFLEDKRNCASLEKEIIQKHLSIQEQTDPWQRRHLKLNRIACYRLLNGQHESTADCFDPKRFVKVKTLNGLLTKVLNASNVRKVLQSSKQDKHTLLVGYASLVKISLPATHRLPSGKQKAPFVHDLWKNEYDSILYSDSNGLDTLVVWDPFPVQAVARIVLSKEELGCLADKLENFDIPDLKDTGIQFSKPPDLIISSSPMVPDDDSDDDARSVESEKKEFNFAQYFAGTKLEGCTVDSNWTGGIDSGGALDRNIEKDLLGKMKFANKDAKPFVAMNQIQKLLSSNQESAILHLLFAAESVAANSHEKAEEAFDAYLQKTNVPGQKPLLHPWSIVVSSRLEKEHSKALLSLYGKLFPYQQGVLSAAELAVIEDSFDATEEDIDTPWPEMLKQEWEGLKAENREEVASQAMDELLDLTGLRKVKEEAIRLWKSALQLKKMDTGTRKKNPITANYCFLGNPGTGKTTVARLFARILCDSGVRESEECEETTAQEAKDGGTDEFRKKVAAAMGGVLFIDEAYDLDPVGDYKGKPIVNELLTLCENKRDDISVILAGYEDDFEKKFFAYNAGLRSRFTTVLFEDFDEDELATIWTGMRSDKGWSEEDGVCKVMVKRLSKLAGKKGFGNAREVRIRLEKATQEAMSRLGDDFCQAKMGLVISDVIGEDPRLSNEKLTKIREEINEKIGWDRVKSQVKELLKLCYVNYGRELMGKPPLDIFLNRMFLGNPGTGKTTCAKLYGRLLKELGFLSKGDVVCKTASDFVGSVVGDSQKTTNQILENAKGKVLIIDEAYALDDNLYGKQVLDTLVEKVQGQPSDDMAVLLLGYEEPMLEMLRKQNPGLTRRFPKEQAFYFDDYDENQLLDILDLNLKRNEIKASLDFKRKALEILGIQKSQTNFGNAGAVETLIKSAMVRAAERDQGSQEICLEDDDIKDPGTERANKSENPLNVLDKLYRMEVVKAKLEKMSKTWEVSKREGDENPKLGHFVFTGSPGTGKTTVARAIADVLFSLGLLPTNKIVESSALDLTAEYVGQTSTKVDDALQEAKGGVLFIDEAYNLGIGPFGREACDSIVAGMTSTKYQDVVIVIAGYPHEIHEMLKSNSGLKSRFTHFFQFPDWEPKDCAAFFQMLAGKNNFELEEGVLDYVHQGCSKLMSLDGWGNGRDVTRLWEVTKENRSERVHQEEYSAKLILVEDVEKAVKDMLAGREPKEASKCSSRSKRDQYNYAFDSSNQAPSKKRVGEAEEGTEEAGSDDGEAQPTPLGQASDRDEGVPDEIWNDLEKIKQNEKEQELEYRKQQHRLRELLAEQEDVDRRREEQERIQAELTFELARLQAEEEEKERKRLEEERQRIQQLIRQEEEHLRRLALERQRIEEEQRRQEEERQKKEAIRQRLQQIRPCPMGFSWHKQGGGWRCGGGSHFVSDAELRRNFEADLWS